MFKTGPLNSINFNIVPFDIRKSSNVYSRNKCEIWAVLWLCEYLAGMTAEQFIMKYREGIESKVSIYKPYLDPAKLGFSPVDVQCMTSFHTSGLQVPTEHVYQYQDYKYRFWRKMLNLNSTDQLSAFNIVYCTENNPLSFVEILAMKKATNTARLVNDLFLKVLDQDGIYVIYLKTDQSHKKLFSCYRHTLSLVKQGQKITFFCPLNGFLTVESSHDVSTCFLKWIENEMRDPASMEYFITSCFYAEAARIPLSAPPGEIVPASRVSLCSCLSCVNPAPLKCSQCMQVSYCSVACQKTDWKLRHKLVCKT